MRDLVRPTLFMFARLGLFLSVVVWMAGLWCNAHAYWTTGNRKAVLTLHETAWVFVDEPGALKNYADLDGSNGMSVTPSTPLDISYDDQWPLLGTGGGAIGPVLAHHVNGGPFPGWFAIRHWPIVFAMLLSNIILHWLYRKPKQESTE